MSKEEAAEVLSIEGREVRVTHPGKLYFSKQTKLSKLDLVRYYLSVAPGALAGIRDRPIVLKRFVNGAEGEAFLPKARARGASLVAANCNALLSFRPNCGRNCRRRCGRAGLDRQSGLHRTASASGALQQPRAPGRTANRSGSRPRRQLGGRSPRRPGSESAARRDRSSRLAQNQRLTRDARECPHPAALDV